MDEQWFSMKNRNTQIVSGVVVLLVVILFGGWWMKSRGVLSKFSSRAATTTINAVLEDATTTNPVGLGGKISNPTAVATGDSVTVKDQDAFSSITVSSVTLSQNGWVAVRDADGRTLGAGWFEAGTHENVAVPLLRSTVAGERYQALLYVDTGDDHQFDVHNETLVTNSDGSVAGAIFKTN